MKRIVAGIAALILAAACMPSDVVFLARTQRFADMHPTMKVGDPFTVDLWAYAANPPQRGDIVMFDNGNKILLTSRVVGVAGDAVQMIGGRLHINGEIVPRVLVGRADAAPESGFATVIVYREQLPGAESDHLIEELNDEDGLDETPEFVVPDGRLFLMGDSRDNSADSRIPDGHPDLAATHREGWSRWNGPRYSGMYGYLPVDNVLGKVKLEPR